MITNPCVMLDIETDGLDFCKNRILEIGAFQFDPSTLKVVGKPFVGAVHIPKDVLNIPLLHPWVCKTHTESGLFDLVTGSTFFTVRTPDGEAVEGCVYKDLDELDSALAGWLESDVGAGKSKETQACLAGNGVGTFDRRFMEEKFMTETLQLCHYRNIDVRTMLTLAEAWSGKALPKVEVAHRALDDCFVSLEGLRWARKELYARGANLNEQDRRPLGL